MQVAKLDTATLDAAENLLLQLIIADGYGPKADGALLKIALIENLLQALKYKHKVIESALTFEEFVESDISVNGGLIKLSAPTRKKEQWKWNGTIAVATQAVDVLAAVP